MLVELGSTMLKRQVLRCGFDLMFVSPTAHEVGIPLYKIRVTCAMALV